MFTAVLLKMFFCPRTGGGQKFTKNQIFFFAQIVRNGPKRAQNVLLPKKSVFCGNRPFLVVRMTENTFLQAYIAPAYIKNCFRTRNFKVKLKIQNFHLPITKKLKTLEQKYPRDSAPHYINCDCGFEDIYGFSYSCKNCFQNAKILLSPETIQA